MPSRRKSKRTLASKTGTSQSKLSAKIAKVRRDDPKLTQRQAAGKAAGVLRHRRHDDAEVY